MSKNSNFLGQPIFSQVINLLDRDAISKFSKEQGSDHYNHYAVRGFIQL